MDYINNFAFVTMAVFINKPYPFIFNRYSVLVPSVITFLLIIFLAPLGFASIDFYERVIIAFVISVIIAFSIYFGVIGLRKLIPNYINEDSWTLGKEFLLYALILLAIILSISIVFIAVVMYQYQEINPFEIFLNVFKRTAAITFGISILPISISILLEQKSYHKRQFLKANILSEKLKKELNEVKAEYSKENDKFIFKSDTGELELQTALKDVIYIKSDGNYIEVYYLNNDDVSKKIMRNRLKNFENALPKSLFFRCHNRYIINKSFITKINGNARGLNLVLKNTDEAINVSRSRIKDFELFLNEN